MATPASTARSAEENASCAASRTAVAAASGKSAATRSASSIESRAVLAGVAMLWLATGALILWNARPAKLRK
jgi:hypothetical protein